MDVVSGYTPEGGKTYTSCYVEYPTTVTPVTAANQVSASDKLTLLLETFNRIKNQLIALPNFTEKMVCDIMFAAVAILGPDLVIEEVVDIKELNEQSVKNNIDFVKNALTSELSGLEFFWKDNLGNIYSDIDEFIYKTGEFKLYSKDLNGVIWQVYSLIIKEKIKDVTFKISDIISEADFGNLKIHLIRA